MRISVALAPRGPILMVHLLQDHASPSEASAYYTTVYGRAHLNLGQSRDGGRPCVSKVPLPWEVAWAEKVIRMSQ
jgi:hypothetical protein